MYDRVMSRLARIVVPGVPHHVTQRGDRREPIFFEDGDQDLYRDLLAEQLDRRRVEVWAYCLTSNHVHLVLAPSAEAGLGLAIGETHRRYTSFINAGPLDRPHVPGPLRLGGDGLRRHCMKLGLYGAQFSDPALAHDGPAGGRGGVDQGAGGQVRPDDRRGTARAQAAPQGRGRAWRPISYSATVN